LNSTFSSITLVSTVDAVRRIVQLVETGMPTAGRATQIIIMMTMMIMIMA